MDSQGQENATPVAAKSSVNFGLQHPLAVVSNNTLSLDNNSLQITQHRLNGRNFREWFQFVTLVIKGKGKFGYLTGAIP